MIFGFDIAYRKCSTVSDVSEHSLILFINISSCNKYLQH